MCEANASQSLEEATGYYKRKVEYLQAQIQNIDKLTQERKNQLGLIVQSIRQAQQPQAAAA